MNRIPSQFVGTSVTNIDAPAPDYEPIPLGNALASEKALEKSKKEKMSIKISVLKVEALQKLTSSFMGKNLNKQHIPFIFIHDHKDQKKKRTISLPFTEAHYFSFTTQTDADIEKRKTILLQGEQNDSIKQGSYFLEHQQKISILDISPTEISITTEKTVDTTIKKTTTLFILPFYSLLFGIFFLGLLLTFFAIRQNSQSFTFLGLFISLIPITCLYCLYYFSKNKKS